MKSNKIADLHSVVAEIQEEIFQLIGEMNIILRKSQNM